MSVFSRWKRVYDFRGEMSRPAKPFGPPVGILRNICGSGLPWPGMSQRAIAEAAGVSKTIIMIETLSIH